MGRQCFLMSSQLGWQRDQENRHHRFTPTPTKSQFQGQGGLLPISMQASPASPTQPCHGHKGSQKRRRLMGRQPCRDHTEGGKESGQGKEKRDEGSWTQRRKSAWRDASPWTSSRQARAWPASLGRTRTCKVCPSFMSTCSNLKEKFHLTQLIRIVRETITQTLGTSEIDYFLLRFVNEILQ